MLCTFGKLGPYVLSILSPGVLRILHTATLALSPSLLTSADPPPPIRLFSFYPFLKAVSNSAVLPLPLPPQTHHPVECSNIWIISPSVSRPDENTLQASPVPRFAILIHPRNAPSPLPPFHPSSLFIPLSFFSFICQSLYLSSLCCRAILTCLSYSFSLPSFHLPSLSC